MGRTALLLGTAAIVCLLLEGFGWTKAQELNDVIELVLILGFVGIVAFGLAASLIGIGIAIYRRFKPSRGQTS